MAGRAGTTKRISAPSQRDLSEVIDSLRSIVRELRLAGRVAEQALGLSSAQLFILQALSETSELSINELAERTFTHQSSVSMVVARLVTSKLVVRKTTKTDGRKASVSLTAAGRAMLKRSPDAGQARLITALSSMRRGDLSILSDHLGELAHLMEAAPRERSGVLGG